MREVTDDTFEREVLAAEGPVIVDFWAPWCGPCKAADRALQELAAARPGRFELVKLDVDAHPLTASRYEVLTLPTAILFEGGEPRSSVPGARSRSGYERAWKAWL